MDRCVTLLESVIAENRRLRETIEARDTEQQQLLQLVASKLDNPANKTTHQSRKRKRSVSVSQQCRQDVRNLYKVLKSGENFEGFIFTESFSSQSNQNVTKAVIEAVVADQGGTGNCAWSPAEMKSAAATYFKSLNDAFARTKKGKQGMHKVACRRQGRMRDKIQRRLCALNTMSWTEKQKAVIAKAITWDYTSSDESDMSDDENGQSCLKGYMVKRLPWERTTLRKAKKALDDAYLKSLAPRARANVLQRRDHPSPSKRSPPPDALEWAVRTSAPETPRATGTTSLAAPGDRPITPTPLTPRPSPRGSVTTPPETSADTQPRRFTLPSPTPRPTPRGSVTTPPTTPEDNQPRRSTCASPSPLTPRPIPSPTDNRQQRECSGVDLTPRIPTRIAAPRTILTKKRAQKNVVRTQTVRSPEY